jgi:hypothetical protein
MAVRDGNVEGVAARGATLTLVTRGLALFLSEQRSSSLSAGLRWLQRGNMAGRRLEGREAASISRVQTLIYDCHSTVGWPCARCVRLTSEHDAGALQESACARRNLLRVLIQVRPGRAVRCWWERVPKRWPLAPSRRNPFTVLQLALAARAARVLGEHRDRPASCFRNASSNPQSHTAVCHSALASSAAAVSCTPQFAARPWPCHQRSAAAHDRPPFILTPPAPCPSRPLSCRFSGAGQWQPARLLCSS